MNDLEQRVKKIEAKEAIHSLKIDFCYDLDNRNIDNIIDNCFMDNAIADYGPRGFYRGIAEIRKFLEETLLSESEPSFIHMLHNGKVEINGDTANGTWYLMTRIHSKKMQDTTWYIGRYDDKFMEIDGSWKISELKLMYFWRQRERIEIE